MKGDTHKSPYKFLDSFTQDDIDTFFGREQEVEELYSKVFQSQLVLVYGASGTGKSSIINCGLANRFKSSDWLPINIRRGGNITRSMYKQVMKESINQVSLPEDMERKPEDLHKLLSSVFLDHFKPIYLIFDQFEELFIFGLEQEWREFIETVHYLMNTDLDVHFIFVIRGEYLEFLSVFEEEIPDFFDNRLRIEKMTRRTAEQIISRPAKLHSISLSEGFEENLLKKLSPDKAHVELTFLQVFLDRIYKKALEEQQEGAPLVLSNDHIERVGQIGDVLAEFVDEQLFRMEDSKAALTVLKAFVSLQGTKRQMSSSDVERYTGNIGNPIGLAQIETILTEFVNKRILKERDENGNYELRHDNLAQKIYEKITLQERELLDVQQFLAYSLNEYNKRGILLNEEDLSYIAPFERSMKLDDSTLEFIKVSKKNSVKQKKSRRTRTIISIIILVLTITSIAASFYSQSQKKRAEELAELASKESMEANRQKKIAEEQRKLAQLQERFAQQQANIADVEREKAIGAQQEAEAQRSEALKQKQIADVQREQAQRSKIDAEQNATEALRSKEIADSERQKAERLRILGLVRELSIKSTYMSDRQPKALLALQALAFNKQYDGTSFNSDLHQALYQARQTYSAANTNSVQAHQRAISDNIIIGSAILSCGEDGKIVRTEHKNGLMASKVLTSTEHIFKCFAVSKDGLTLFIGTQTGMFAVMDVSGNALKVEKKLIDAPIIKIVVTEHNEIIAIGANGEIAKTDANGSEVRVVSLNERLVDAELDESTGTIWAVNSNNELLSIKSLAVSQRVSLGVKSKVKKIAVSSNNEIVALGFENGNIGLWKNDESRITQNLVGHVAAITDLQFDESGNFLASGSFDRSVRIWKLDQLQDQSIVIPNHDDWVGAVAITNEFVVTGTYKGTATVVSLGLDALSAGLCDSVGRNLTEAEWAEYIGLDIKQTNTCK